MIKKTSLLSIFVMFILAIILSINNTVDAAKFLNGNQNYVYAGGGGGSMVYIYRPTVESELYNPPIYILTAKIKSISKINGDSTGSIRFKYDYANRKMYSWHDDKEEWEYIPENNSTKLTYYGYYKTIGDMLFYLAYRMPFYPTIKNSSPDRYSDLFY